MALTSSEAGKAYLEELKGHRTAQEVDVVVEIITWCVEKGLKEEFGAEVPTKGIPYWPRIPRLEGRGSSPFQLWTRNKEGVTFSYQDLLKRKPFNIEAKGAELFRRIQEIPGVDQKPHWPSLSLDALRDSETRKEFFRTVEWIVNALQRANHDVRL